MSAKSKAYPPTPELDKMHAVVQKSQAIGEFIDVFLTEKGIELCKYQKSGNNGKPQYRWKEGVKVRKLNKRPIGDSEPCFEDVFNLDAEHNPEYEKWTEGYFAIHTNIQTLLAEFFGIDLKKVEAERMAVLEYIRCQNETEASNKK